MILTSFALLFMDIGSNNAPRIIAPTTKPPIESVEIKCNAKPYKYLIGRNISDVLSAKLPKNTRIYRIGDDPKIGEAGKNRLNIEISNRTIVRRVYCS